MTKNEHNLFEGFSQLPADSDVPHQTLLRERLAVMLGDRRLTPGDKLPSIREVSQHFGVSQITAQQVYDLLAEKGIISKKHGKGSFMEDNGGRILHAPCMRLSVSVSKPPQGENFIQSAANLLTGFFMGAGARGWSVNFEDGREDGGEFEDIMSKYRGRASDGMAIIGGMGMMEECIARSNQAGMPLVLINNLRDNARSVVADMENACAKMTAALLDEGLRSFGIFSSQMENPRFSGIEKGVGRELESRGGVLRPEFVRMMPILSPDEHEQNRRAALEMAAAKDFPQVVFCSPESKTLAMSRALEETGRHDVTIVSVDDSNRIGRVWERRLLRIKVPYFEIGRAAGDILAGSIAEGKRPAPGTVRVECPLVMS